MRKPKLDRPNRRGSEALPARTDVVHEQEPVTATESETAVGGPQQDPVVTKSWILLARISWMIIGPMALVIVCLGIANSSTGWLTPADAAYFAILGLMIACRWAEQRSGQATTATGEPATWFNFNRYVAALVPLAVVVWIVVNVIGNHVRPRL
jgi:hypothetical protein